MKVGIFGGTFDPIHIAHLIIAEHVREGARLDQIWFVPTKIPPHKDGKRGASAEDRLEMVKLAIEGIPYFRASAIEFERPGPSYTIETVKRLKKLYPDYDFSFIIGGDMIEYLPHWHRIDDLVAMIRFIGARRPGYEISDVPYAQSVQMVDIPLMDVSSTMVRERLLRNQSIRFMVPEQVRKYIEVKRLYEA